jgi:hypothetical protein
MYMSAIDFDLEIDRLANPKGDRVRMVMSGKFCRTNITVPSRACRNTGSRRSDGLIGARRCKTTTPHSRSLALFRQELAPR